MPGYKRNFRRRVMKVIRDDQETKRCIVTRQIALDNSNGLFTNQSSDPLVVHFQNTTGDFQWNSYCWQIGHNIPRFWPIPLCSTIQGVRGGHADGINKAGGQVEYGAIRLGSEIFCKGVSLDFMAHLLPQFPHALLKVKLIRHAKDDFPRAANVVKGYTGVRELDMFDTRRFNILKEWKFYLKQNQPTTAGAEVDVDGDGTVGKDMNTDAYDGNKIAIVLQDSVGKSKDDWEQFILDNYPAYRGATAGDNLTDDMLHEQGLNYEDSVLLFRYSNVDIYQGHGTQLYYIHLESAAQDRSTWIDKHNASSWTASPSGIAKQCVIVKKVGTHKEYGMARPAEGQVLVPMDKKCSLWIPGKMLYNNGYVRYKEKSNITSETDHLFDYCLMFETYLNYQTWDYTTVAAATVYPEMVRISDFLQVTYYKDP